jgi:hypothetical protein
MADITGYLTPFKNMPHNPHGLTPFRKQFTLGVTSTDAGGVPQIADVIRLGVLNRGAVIISAKLIISATLGAGCILQLRRDTTALTAASTAAAANYLLQTAIDTPSTDFDDSLNLVISGAVVGASATVTVELIMMNWAAGVY